MTLPLGRAGIGHRELDAGRFEAAAAALERLAATGLARIDHRAAQRRGVSAAASAVTARWRGPEARAVVQATQDWCVGGENVEHQEAEAYRSLRELAVAAWSTAEVIGRVERFERSWLEQAGASGIERGTRGGLNLLDAVGAVSDEDAQRARELIDARNRITEQASAERAQALDLWLRAMEATAAAVHSALEALRFATVDAPEPLRPREGRSAEDARRELLLGWSSLVRRRITAPPTDGEPEDLDVRMWRWWNQASPEERAALMRTAPDLVTLIMGRIPPDQLLRDPTYGDLYRLVLEERDRNPEHTAVNWLRRAWSRYPKVADTVTVMREVAGGARQADLAELRRLLEGLTGPEIDAVIDQLSDDELADLVGQLRDPWVKGGLSPDELRDWENVIGSRASLATLRRLDRAGWEELAPDPARAGGDAAAGARSGLGAVTNQPLAGPVFSAGTGEDRDIRIGDLRQGAVGDCYLIVALQSLADRDPEAIRRMITANPNGTYSVTFADGGVVTVIPDFPTVGGRLTFAQNPVQGERELWPMIIEKAYAQKHGGWPEIEGGWSSDAIEELSGRKASAFAGRDATASEIGDRLDRGEIISAGTLPDTSWNILRGRSPVLPDTFTRGAKDDIFARLYPSHAYIVTEVDRQRGTISVLNPWDPTQPPLVLTEQEFRDSMDTVYVNEAR